MATTLHTLNADDFKVRWQEPYGSEGFNRKLAGVVSPGVYRGFLTQGSVTPCAVSLVPEVDTYNSVAVIEDSAGVSVTVQHVGNYDLDLTALANSTVILTMRVVYTVGAATTGEIIAYSEAEWAALTASDKQGHVTLARVVVGAANQTIPVQNIDTNWRARNVVKGGTLDVASTATVGGLLTVSGGIRGDVEADGTAGSALTLGGTSQTGAVSVSRTGQTTTVQGALAVSQGIRGDVEAPGVAGSTLSLGTTAQTGAVHLGGNGLAATTVQGTLNVDQAATFDSTVGVTGLLTASGGVRGGVEAAGVAGSTLNVGTTTQTGAVTVSRAGQTTTVQGALNVDQAATFDSTVGVTGVLTASGGVQGGVEAPGAAGSALNVGTTAQTGDVNIGRAGQVTTVQGSLEITGGVVNAVAGGLSLGTATQTTTVGISRAGQTTTVQGALNVDQAATFDSTVGVTGLLTASGGVQGNVEAAGVAGSTLALGTTAQTGAVHVSRAGQTTTVQGALNVDQAATFDSTVDVTGALTVTGGAHTGALEVDGGVINAVAGALSVGTSAQTTAVNISQAGDTTTVQGALNVDQAATFDSTVGVTGLLTASGGVRGDVAAAGAAGSTLALGTTTQTGAVTISRTGQTTTIQGALTVSEALQAQGLPSANTALTTGAPWTSTTAVAWTDLSQCVHLEGGFSVAAAYTFNAGSSYALSTLPAQFSSGARLLRFLGDICVNTSPATTYRGYVQVFGTALTFHPYDTFTVSAVDTLLLSLGGIVYRP